MRCFQVVALASLMLSTMMFAGCQKPQESNSTAITTPVTSGGAPIVPALASLTPESCQQTFESFMAEINAHPDKYKEENYAAYPEMQAWSQTIHACQVKGFINQQAMMSSMEKMALKEEAVSGELADEN